MHMWTQGRLQPYALEASPLCCNPMPLCCNPMPLCCNAVPLCCGGGRNSAWRRLLQPCVRQARYGVSKEEVAAASEAAEEAWRCDDAVGWRARWAA